METSALQAFAGFEVMNPYGVRDGYERRKSHKS